MDVQELLKKQARARQERAVALKAREAEQSAPPAKPLVPAADQEQLATQSKMAEELKRITALVEKLMQEKEQEKQSREALEKKYKEEIEQLKKEKDANKKTDPKDVMAKALENAVKSDTSSPELSQRMQVQMAALNLSSSSKNLVALLVQDIKDGKISLTEVKEILKSEKLDGDFANHRTALVRIVESESFKEEASKDMSHLDDAKYYERIHTELLRVADKDISPTVLQEVAQYLSQKSSNILDKLEKHDGSTMMNLFQDVDFKELKAKTKIPQNQLKEILVNVLDNSETVSKNGTAKRQIDAFKTIYGRQVNHLGKLVKGQAYIEKLGKLTTEVKTLKKGILNFIKGQNLNESLMKFLGFDNHNNYILVQPVGLQPTDAKLLQLFFKKGAIDPEGINNLANFFEDLAKFADSFYDEEVQQFVADLLHTRFAITVMNTNNIERSLDGDRLVRELNQKNEELANQQRVQEEEERRRVEEEALRIADLVRQRENALARQREIELAQQEQNAAEDRNHRLNHENHHAEGSFNLDEPLEHFRMRAFQPHVRR